MSAAQGSTAVLGALLAGGRSRRMGGGDKWMLQLAGRPLVEHVADRLGPQVHGLVLNSNGDPDALRRFALPVVPDTLPDRPGPLAGLLAALRHAERLGPIFGHVLIAAADTPFLPQDLVRRMWAGLRTTGAEVAIAASGRRLHPVVALVPVRLADRLESDLRDGRTARVATWFEQFAVAEVIFHGDPDPFFNINHPDDLAEAERLIAGAR